MDTLQKRKNKITSYSFWFFHTSYNLI